jgi:hypothetical protein
MSYLLTENYRNDLVLRMIEFSQLTEALYEDGLLFENRHLLNEAITEEKTMEEAKAVLEEMQAFKKLLPALGKSIKKLESEENAEDFVEIMTNESTGILGYILREMNKLEGKVKKIEKNGMGFFRTNILGAFGMNPLIKAQQLMLDTSGLMAGLNDAFKQMRDYLASEGTEEGNLGDFAKKIDPILKGFFEGRGRSKWESIYSAMPWKGVEITKHVLVNKKATVDEFEQAIKKLTLPQFAEFSKAFAGVSERAVGELEGRFQQSARDQAKSAKEGDTFFSRLLSSLGIKPNKKAQETAGGVFGGDDPAASLKALQQTGGQIDPELGKILAGLKPQDVNPLMGAEGQGLEQILSKMAEKLMELGAEQEKMTELIATLKAAGDGAGEEGSGEGGGRLPDDVFALLAKNLADADPEDNIGEKEGRSIVGKAVGQEPFAKLPVQQAGYRRKGNLFSERRIHGASSLAGLLFEDDVPYADFFNQLQPLVKDADDTYSDEKEANKPIGALAKAINQSEKLDDVTGIPEDVEVIQVDGGDEEVEEIQQQASDEVPGPEEIPDEVKTRDFKELKKETWYIKIGEDINEFMQKNANQAGGEWSAKFVITLKQAKSAEEVVEYAKGLGEAPPFFEGPDAADKAEEFRKLIAEKMAQLQGEGIPDPGESGGEGDGEGPEALEDMADELEAGIPEDEQGTTEIIQQQSWWQRTKDSLASAFQGAKGGVERAYNTFTSAWAEAQDAAQLRKALLTLSLEMKKAENAADLAELKGVNDALVRAAQELSDQLNAAEGKVDELEAAAREKAEEIAAITDSAMESDEPAAIEIIEKLLSASEADSEKAAELIQKLKAGELKEAERFKKELTDVIKEVENEKALTDELTKAKAELTNLLGEKDQQIADLQAEVQKLVSETPNFDVMEEDAQKKALEEWSKLFPELANQIKGDTTAQKMESMMDVMQKEMDTLANTREELEKAKLSGDEKNATIEDLTQQLADLYSESGAESQTGAGLIRWNDGKTFFQNLAKQAAEGDEALVDMATQMRQGKQQFANQNKAVTSVMKAFNTASPHVPKNAMFKLDASKEKLAADEAAWHQGDIIVERWQKLAGILK